MTCRNDGNEQIHLLQEAAEEDVVPVDAVEDEGAVPLIPCRWNATLDIV